MADETMNTAPMDTGMGEEESLPTEAPQNSMMSHTVDEIPQLAGMQVGDTLLFKIAGISDDGSTYDLEVSEEGAGMPEEAAGGLGESLI